jgi:isoaspartyl peptidase/L-asparaginase-like protein (Ntn-hydrolase superfamily)
MLLCFQPCKQQAEPSMPEPLILATWSFGQKATAAGWPYLDCEKSSSLDAVEQACRAVEADETVLSVGVGGLADRAGEVTLDASIMLSPDRCGAVCCVRRYAHPVSIARRVMERSSAVLLAGEGADRFAARQGFEASNIMTDRARATWQHWIALRPDLLTDDSVDFPLPENFEELALAGEHGVGATAGLSSSASGTGEQATRGTREILHDEPITFSEEHDAQRRPCNLFHDTVGVLAMDRKGQMAGACSTSGLPFKLPGRVGDSPIIGHGLYVDPRRGAAVATGTGELIMGACGSFLAVELMGRGNTPAEAAAEVIRRIAESRNHSIRDDQQAAVIALHPSGRWSAAALRPGYQTAVRDQSRDEMVGPEFVLLI